MKQPLVITPAYDKLLFGLYHLHLSNAEQLCRFCSYKMGCIKKIHERLVILSSHNYVQTNRLMGYAHRPPHYFVLGREGIRYLRECGRDIGESVRAGKETNKSYPFAVHTLELNDVIISASNLEEVQQTGVVYRLDKFMHERELKRRPFTGIYQGKTFKLEPDALLYFRAISLEGERPIRIILEQDRGTEEQRNFRWKIRKYATKLKSEPCTIAFTTFESEKRVAQMRTWTQAELTQNGDLQSVGHLFYFANLTKPLDPGKIWLEPFFYPLNNEQPISLLAQHTKGVDPHAK